MWCLYGAEWGSFTWIHIIPPNTILVYFYFQTLRVSTEKIIRRSSINLKNQGKLFFFERSHKYDNTYVTSNIMVVESNDVARRLYNYCDIL